jgi:hypothetical protein
VSELVPAMRAASAWGRLRPMAGERHNQFSEQTPDGLIRRTPVQSRQGADQKEPPLMIPAHGPSVARYRWLGTATPQRVD